MTTKDDTKTSESKTDENPPKNLSDSSKTVMAWAHFIAKTWHDHFNSPDNKCEFLAENESMPDILSNVFVFGGGSRDYVLNLPINDLDSQVNSQPMDEMFKDHLEKYHSSKKESQDDKVKCILWRIYRNRHYNRKVDAQYLIDLLRYSKLLKGNVNYYDNDFLGVKLYHVIVLKSIKYENYDFKDLRLDFSNMFKPKIDEEVNVCEEYASHRHKNWVSNEDTKIDESDEVKYATWDCDLNNDGLIDIIVDVSKNTLVERMAGNDFSLNSMLVYYNTLYSPVSPRKILYEWKVIGTIDDDKYNNGFHDCQNQVINTPCKDAILTLKYNYNKKYGSSNFWRLLKFSGRYGEKWSIGDRLISDTIKFHDLWINDERFTEPKRLEKMIDGIFTKYVKDPLKQHPIRFKTMQKLKFHEKVIPYFNKYKQFKEDTLTHVKSKDEKEAKLLMDLLKEYKYL